MKIAVFQSRASHNWIALYRPGQYDSFPTWREAVDHAFTIARLRGVIRETLRRTQEGEGQ